MPRDPGDALATLLGSLGVPPQQIPADLETRAAFYRDRLAGTRTMVVLDNAADEAQVRPLLPASDTCLVVVTSRRRLKTLDDALPLTLDVLPLGEAVALLRKSARLGQDPGNEALLEQAAELCGRLPLALVIAAALLRTGGKAWNLTVLIDRLAPRWPGDELAGFTDETRSLTPVFDLSYDHLLEDLQLLFRRLGLLPGPEIDAYAAAALLDTDPDQAGRLLQRLADQSLLTGAAPGRYRPHDLIRAHARTLAVAHDPEPEREAALGRLLHYYAHTAQSASQPIARFPRPAPDGRTPTYTPALPDADAARIWLRTEHPNLDAAFTHAHTHALHDHTIALAAGMAEILLTDGPFTRALEIHQTAADTAEHQDNASAHATALNDLGRVRYLTGDLPGADSILTRASELFRELGHALGEAYALTERGRVRYMIGDYPAADSTLTQALELFRELGHSLGEAYALTEFGRVRYLTGDFPAAGDAHARALELFRELGHGLGEAYALTDLGRVRYMTGNFPGADNALTQALELCRALGDRRNEAYALTELGRVRYTIGDLPGADDALTRALELFQELGHGLGNAYALHELGRVRYRTGDLSEADNALNQALEFCRALGHRLVEAYALTDLGSVRDAMGDLPEADHALTRALQLFRELGHGLGEVYALIHYAAALAARGQHPRAVKLYQQALAVNRDLGKPDYEAISLEGLGEHHLATGDISQGIAYLNQALEIYQRLGMNPDIERVRNRLAESAGTDACPWRG